MTENDISYQIRGSIFDVYNKAVSGLSESAYEAALYYELKKKGLEVKTQVGLPFVYEDLKLDVGYFS